MAEGAVRTKYKDELSESENSNHFDKRCLGTMGSPFRERQGVTEGEGNNKLTIKQIQGTSAREPGPPPPRWESGLREPPKDEVTPNSKHSWHRVRGSGSIVPKLLTCRAAPQDRKMDQADLCLKKEPLNLSPGSTQTQNVQRCPLSGSCKGKVSS